MRWLRTKCGDGDVLTTWNGSMEVGMGDGRDVFEKMSSSPSGRVVSGPAIIWLYLEVIG